MSPNGWISASGTAGGSAPDRESHPEVNTEPGLDECLRNTNPRAVYIPLLFIIFVLALSCMITGFVHKPKIYVLGGIGCVAFLGFVACTGWACYNNCCSGVQTQTREGESQAQDFAAIASIPSSNTGVTPSPSAPSPPWATSDAPTNGVDYSCPPPSYESCVDASKY